MDLVLVLVSKLILVVVFGSNIVTWFICLRASKLTSVQSGDRNRPDFSVGVEVICFLCRASRFTAVESWVRNFLGFCMGDRNWLGFSTGYLGFSMWTKLDIFCLRGSTSNGFTCRSSITWFNFHVSKMTWSCWAGRTWLVFREGVE